MDLNAPLHPDFPVVSGNYQFTKKWALYLPFALSRRIEEGSLILWRPGFTIYIAVWGDDSFKNVSELVDWLKKDISSNAEKLQCHSNDKSGYISYRLKEENAAVPDFYHYAVSADSYVQMAIYYDEESDTSYARQITASITATLQKND